MSSPQVKRRRTWKKTVAFISDKRKRQRFDVDNVRQLRAKVNEWNVKTKAPIACFVYVNGRVNFITTPGLKELARNKSLQAIISRYICDEGAAGDQRDESGSANGRTVIIPDDFATQNVHGLREIVMDIATCNGKQNAHWGIDSKKPWWWPSSIQYVSPQNNRVKPRPRREDLLTIVQSFVDSRAKIPLNGQEELEEEDEINDEGNEDSVDEGDVPDDAHEDIDNLCGMLDRDMTLNVGKMMMNHMASLEWKNLKTASEQILCQSMETLQSLTPKVNDPIQERHIRIWSRHIMPEKAAGYEPVDIAQGEDSLFRSTSRLFFGTEKFWIFLKIWTLAEAVMEADYFMNQMSCDDQTFCSSTSKEHLVTNYQEAIYDSLLETKSEAEDSPVKMFLLEAASLSKFLAAEIRILFQNNEEVVFGDATMSRRLSFVSDMSHQVVPVVRLENEVELDGKARCDARARCLVSSTFREEQSVRCKYCLWSYHPSCIGMNNAVDDCGCASIPETRLRLDAFKHLSTVSALFDCFEAELKALVEGLYLGSIQSCRNVRFDKIRKELNCFIAGIPFDVDEYIIGKVADWIEQGEVETIVDGRRRDDFFCHIAIREVQMYLIIKEVKVGRLAAERAVRKFLAPHYPSPGD